jgi:hypothetical protein
MPPASISETESDRRVMRELWAVVAAAWPSKQALADALGIDRTLIPRYITGERNSGFPALRAALRITADRHPDRASSLVEAFARHVLDVDGAWLADEACGDLGTVIEEAVDVGIAQGELLSAVRSGDATAIERATAKLIREAVEVGAARRAVR